MRFEDDGKLKIERKIRKEEKRKSTALYDERTKGIMRLRSYGVAIIAS